ncbi:MAG: DUF2905 domain-containing protein [Nitrospirae bacterium]|nr:DUF2905 domain-containing protein [Nitrospirota bacterium]
MPDWSGVGKILLLMGGILALLGAFLTLMEKFPSLGGGFGWFGKLPGDILIKRDQFTFYFPFTTSVLISVVVSLLLYFLSRR